MFARANGDFRAHERRVVDREGGQGAWVSLGVFVCVRVCVVDRENSRSFAYNIYCWFIHELANSDHVHDVHEQFLIQKCSSITTLIRLY